MTTRWTIGIDWDRDGNYTDETARVLLAKWSLGCQQAYMDVSNDAQLRLVMRNEDKRFTPENSAGSLFDPLAQPERNICREGDPHHLIDKSEHYAACHFPLARREPAG